MIRLGNRCFQSIVLPCHIAGSVPHRLLQTRLNIIPHDICYQRHINYSANLQLSRHDHICTGSYPLSPDENDQSACKVSSRRCLLYAFFAFHFFGSPENIEDQQHELAVKDREGTRE